MIREILQTIDGRTIEFVRPETDAEESSLRRGENNGEVEDVSSLADYEHEPTDADFDQMAEEEGR